MKRSIVCYCLVLLVLTFSSVAAANPPYASILAYTQNSGSTPVMNSLAVLNVINMTPWEIYVGNPNGKDILHGFSGAQVTQATNATPMPVNSFWLKGITGANDSSGGHAVAAGASGFAFHSVQIGLNDPNNSWVQTTAKNNPNYNPQSVDLTNKQSGTTQKHYGCYAYETAYISMPIVINSTSGQVNAKTAALNFMVTGSGGFAKPAGMSVGTWMFSPAGALSYGDGVNNYGWSTGSTNVANTFGTPPYNGTKNVAQFLTIQATGDNSAWAPLPVSAGTLAQPTYLNTAGMIYANFSTVSGVTAVNGINYDLVVILQAGDYADYSLIFLATPQGTAPGGK
ncbi:MAG: hypothetical protein P4N41_14495 [Negativicutes bacterium]|nr:hypothetical protein [Negativicutes bacterium]